MCWQIYYKNNMLHRFKQIYLFRFILFLLHRFSEDRCFQHAAALAYTTLLSLVPLLAVVFAVATAFPIFEHFNEQFQEIIFENFVPTSSIVVQNYIQDFVKKTSQLTAAGIWGLIIVSLMLIATIDRALNTIWRTPKTRGLLMSFLVYWSLLTLGPLFIGASLAATSYLVSLPLISYATSSTSLLLIMPFLLSVFAFSLLYIIAPNHTVIIKHGIAGGLFAALLFEIAKKGFALYVKHFPTYETIYGTLAIIPFFLVWIYISWVIALLGAELTHGLGAFRDDGNLNALPPEDEFYFSFRILGHLWQAQQTGSITSTEQLLRLESTMRLEGLEQILYQLEKVKFIHTTEAGNWALSRDLSHLTLLELYQAQPFVLPKIQQLRLENLWDRALADILKSLYQNIDAVMPIPLAKLYQSDN